MNKCPVSVIIPTYNRSSLLSRAVESVFCQTMQCAELVIVDDGSTDNTQEILRKLSTASQVPLRVCLQKNRGPAAARNLGVQRAEYPYIAFLDSDDHWHKRKLERQYNSLVENSDYRISHTQEKWLRRGQHLNKKIKHLPRHGDIFDHCLQLCAVGMSTVMMQRELFSQVGLFDESLRCCEDYDLWLRISCRHHFLLVDEPLTVKEGGREDQVSVQYRQGMDRMRIASLRKLLDGDVLSCRQHRLALAEFRNKVTIFGKGCLKHHKEELGTMYLELIPKYEKMAVDKFPLLEEALDG